MLMMELISDVIDSLDCVVKGDKSCYIMTLMVEYDTCYLKTTYSDSFEDGYG